MKSPTDLHRMQNHPIALILGRAAHGAYRDALGLPDMWDALSSTDRGAWSAAGVYAVQKFLAEEHQDVVDTATHLAHD